MHIFKRQIKFVSVPTLRVQIVSKLTFQAPIAPVMLCLLASAFSPMEAAHAQSGGKTLAEKPAGVAVVELFTSQGCSSCPPADQLLVAVAELNSQQNLPVYCLSFHVDYWNSLGWTDPFSSKHSTARQRSYAATFKSDRVYTPQMVVNGAVEFVGSNADQAKQALKAALNQPATSKIDLQAQPASDDSRVAVKYVVSGGKPDELLNMALVQITANNEVPQGENAGKNLAHVNVVRGLQTFKLKDPRGQATFALPEGLKSGQARIIAYTQNRETGQVSGASAIALAAE